MTSSDNEHEDPNMAGSTEETAETKFYQDNVVIVFMGEGGPKAMEGTVVVRSGRLLLYGEEGQLLDSAPVSSIPMKHAWRWIGTAKLEWNDKVYDVVMYTGPASGLAALIGGFLRCRQLRRALVAEQQKRADRS